MNSSAGITTRALGVASFTALSIVVNSHAVAQTAPGATALDPIVVQSPAQQRAAKPAAPSRARVTRASAGRSRGTAQQMPSAPAAQSRGAESAWGHVDGYVATRSGTATKTDTPLIETPAAVSVITQDQIKAQGAQSIAQAVRYTAGVKGEVTGADARTDNVYIRGFLADQGYDVRSAGSGAGLRFLPFSLCWIAVGADRTDWFLVGLVMDCARGAACGHRLVRRQRPPAVQGLERFRAKWTPVRREENASRL